MKQKILKNYFDLNCHKSFEQNNLCFSGTNTLLQSNKTVLTDTLKEQGRGAQASLKAMTAAQKKAEQLGLLFCLNIFYRFISKQIFAFN